MSNKTKGTWTMKKIEKLIQLYRKQECLWNPSHLNYKNKAKRTKAALEICREIEVTPEQFMKKVHNLRNQFNAEYKRFEKQLEEVDMLEGSQTVQFRYKSKWAHFEPLMFLKSVILRRSSSPIQNLPTPPPVKKPFLESNNADDDVQTYDDNDIEIDEDFNKLEEDFQDLTSMEESPNNNNAAITTPNRNLSRLPTSAMQLKKMQPTAQDQSNSTQKSTNSTIFDFNTNSGLQNSIVNVDPTKPIQTSTIQIPLNQQDQWDAFGSFIANEMRNYNSDLSRRKLKRKIMQAMLEVAEDDELLV